MDHAPGRCMTHLEPAMKKLSPPVDSSSDLFGQAKAQAWRRCAAALALACAGGAAMASNVGLLIVGGGQYIEQNNIGSTFAALDISYASGHGSVSGALRLGDGIDTGKKALVIYGKVNQYLLQEGFDAADDPLLGHVQKFKLDVYSFVAPSDVDALLTGYKVRYFAGTVNDVCTSVMQPDCNGTPVGWFDVTSEMGNGVDTLRLAVQPADVPLPVPEPSSLLLTGIALAALRGVRKA